MTWKKPIDPDAPIKPAFPMGRLLVTQEVEQLVLKHAIPAERLLACLLLHLAGDFGDVGEEDWKANERAMKEGTRIFSVYRAEGGPTLFIITDATRQSTTIMRPEDY